MRVSGGGIRPWLLMATVSLAMVVGFSKPASASAIRTESRVVTSIDSLGPAWAEFLGGGPALWAERAAPPIPAHRILPKQDGLLVETPFVEYLVWRRDLKPSRFDHYHPILGPELGLLTPPTGPTVTSAGTGPVTTPVPLIPIRETPEPGSLLIALALIGSACAWGKIAPRSRLARTVS